MLAGSKGIMRIGAQGRRLFGSSSPLMNLQVGDDLICLELLLTLSLAVNIRAHEIPYIYPPTDFILLTTFPVPFSKTLAFISSRT